MFYAFPAKLYSRMFYIFYIIYSWRRRYTGDLELVGIKRCNMVCGKSVRVRKRENTR